MTNNNNTINNIKKEKIFLSSISEEILFYIKETLHFFSKTEEWNLYIQFIKTTLMEFNNEIYYKVKNELERKNDFFKNLHQFIIEYIKNVFF